MDKINDFFSQHCSDPPIFDSRDFPWTRVFRDNWKTILREFEDYRNKHEIPAYKDINEEVSAGTEGWKSLFLRAFNNDTQIITQFPFTKSLLDTCDCTTAYFSMLEPGTHIPEHRGIYKGVIRYHLALKVPQDNANCFIVVDGRKLFWEEGSDLMFDDMFLHHVENNTKEQRVVLFLDIKRDFKNPQLNNINDMSIQEVKNTPMVQETVSKSNKLASTFVELVRN